ncbi:hypothetical protein [Virgisporangium aurantiacum]|uniref:hypothetical protein n=1 Tax=Virgisporangium aurantiacum TaxID=175570 RepID=UPI0019526F4C|nr:hypothetical protein [Virgisporangium aurantiacum]
MASHLVHFGGDSGGLAIHALRPPTFARLIEVVDAAYRAGRPFQVVHFDGHGTCLNLDTETGVRSGTAAGGSGV